MKQFKRDDIFEKFDKNKYGSLGIKDVKSEGCFSSPFSKEDRHITWSDKDSKSSNNSPCHTKSCKIIEASPCRLMRRIKSDSDLCRRVETIGERLPSNYSELMRKPTPYPTNTLHIINTCFECNCSNKIDIITNEIQFICPICAKVYKKILTHFIIN